MCSVKITYGKNNDLRFHIVVVSFIDAYMIETTWWRHQMETFSALLALCAGNSSFTGEFPTQRPATRSFEVSFDVRLNQHLSNQWRRG